MDYFVCIFSLMGYVFMFFEKEGLFELKKYAKIVFYNSI